jgi:hypothetical protein
MIQAFSLIFNFFNIASPCGDMKNALERFRTVLGTLKGRWTLMNAYEPLGTQVE